MCICSTRAILMSIWPSQWISASRLVTCWSFSQNRLIPIRQPHMNRGIDCHHLWVANMDWFKLDTRVKAYTSCAPYSVITSENGSLTADDPVSAPCSFQHVPLQVYVPLLAPCPVREGRDLTHMLQVRICPIGIETPQYQSCWPSIVLLVHPYWSVTQ